MFQQQDHLKSQLQDSQQASRQLFQCQECGKQYSTQLGYRRHLVAAHSPAPGLPCPEGAASLLEHLGSHNDRPPPPPEGHSNNNNNSGGGGGGGAPVRERKYSCERCDRRFYTRKDVRRHAVVHTGRRDFLCPRCAQRFGRRDHLTRHLKKSHAQETGLTAGGGGGGTTPAAGGGAPAPATPTCPVKEEPSPVTCDLGGGAASKEPPEAFSMDMYNSYPAMANPIAGIGHHHHPGLMQGSGMGVARHMPAPSPHPHPHHHPQQQQPPQQQPAYGNMPRYQHGSTSYPRVDMESFLLDLQSGLPPHLSTGPGCASSSSASPPQRGEALVPETPGGVPAPPGSAGDPHLLSRSPALSSAELSCAANMDLGPLLGFLPFGLPPYSAHMGMGGLVMGYPSTSNSATSSPSSAAAGLSSQAPGPFTLLQPPQAHVPQGPGVGAHNHNQLPQGYSSPTMSTSGSLPRYYQAFQQ